tara:strand:+ start:1001 stop:1435 length:435 start_codon:yes stop_codon:yes gene_type:complete
MNANNQIAINNINHTRNLSLIRKVGFLLLFLSGVSLLTIQKANTDELFLKCTGKFEINRGELIKPDWETSYLRINLNGLKSTIEDKGIKKEGRTLIRRNSYTITHRDNSRIKTKYQIQANHGNYKVDDLQRNRTLIGTCEKGRG